jgi:hypothetical protein
MIYLIYEKQELIAETDSLEYLKKVVKAHPDCAVRELGTGKTYKPTLTRKRPAERKTPSGPRRAKRAGTPAEAKTA